MSLLTKEKLQGHKTLSILGQKFVIRKINPVMDFLPEQMPNLFTGHNSKRDIGATFSPKVLLEQMQRIVEAGVVSPELVPIGKGDRRGKEDGLTVEDLFRDEEIGAKLYIEIMLHSLNRFRGLKSLFFSLKNRLRFWIVSLVVTGLGRQR
jgi:hypothetical protein